MSVTIIFVGLACAATFALAGPVGVILVGLLLCAGVGGAKKGE